MKSLLLSPHRLALVGVLAAYLTLAVVYNASIPVFEAPDEIWHYMYVRNLAMGQGLPVDDGRDSRLLSQQEAAQPPLYYVVAAALTFWAPRGDLAAIAVKNVAGSQGDAASVGNKNLFLHSLDERFPWPGETLTVHLVRLTSTLWGLLTVAVTYRIGRLLFASPWLALAAAAVVAFNPEFIFMSAAVNNDVAVAAASAVLLLLTVEVSRGGYKGRGSVYLGVATGAVVLAKPIAAGVALLVLPALVLSARRRGISLPSFAGDVGKAILASVVVCGGWFVNNLVTYGSLLPLQTFLSRNQLFDTIPSIGEFVGDLGSFRLSFWAVFGWFSILAPSRFYQYVDVLEIIAVVGLAVAIIGRWFRGRKPLAANLEGVGFAAGQLLLVAVGVFAYRLIVLAFQGRLLLGAMSGVGILLAFGWASLAGRRFGPPFALVLSLTLGVAAALMPFRVIQPSYAAPPTFEPSAVHPRMTTAVRFGDDIRLLGADVDPPLGSRIDPGQAFHVRLYFTPIRIPTQNDVLFLTLVDVRGDSIAAINSHPGHGSRPTENWRPGSVVVDDYDFQIPTKVKGPSAYRLFLGFFPLETMENITVWADDGKALGTSYQLGGYIVSGAVDEARASKGIKFQEDGRDVISLLENRLPIASSHPGATLGGSLVFGNMAPLVRDYTVFIHLDRQGKLVAQDDSLPAHGAFPTLLWRPGDIVEHPWQMTIPPASTLGDYDLSAGFYDVASGQRLSTGSNNSVSLGTIQIR